ncbi:monocarboxylate transporter 6 isoform X1 [Larimichthys crocea]|uniref:monocarboxylate transporter 6 isoform X1 n=2 Tax=Larimichthys crocea TaxID=215358 RepID=UPI000F5D4E7B|nr:monocarboxylate transporter 6-like isoform X1 [Larimichthys crocea]XP_027141161.1 monocarboxylate transporter 6-like isoform X1 [Larimichthys crocea]
MPKVVEDQTPATKNGPSHSDNTLLRRESKKKVEKCPESVIQHGDSQQENQEEEEQESASCPSDAMQVGGSTARKHLAAPDGGWGWVVLVATMLVLSLTLALPSCMGIFYTDLQTEFNASNTETSWVPAIMTAMLHAGGPLCSMLVERFGCRATVMVGGLLSGLGMVFSSLARTFTDIYITSGITGLGLCFSFQPSVTMMGHYFERRRVFANALSTTGTAVGLSSLPLITNALLGQFGWRGSFLILGGMLLNCCVCGALMRPVASNKPRNSQVWEKTSNLSLQKETKGLKDIIAFLYRHMAFDLLVSNARYRAYTVGVTWTVLGFLLPLLYLVPYATHHNITIDHAAFLMSILGLVNIAVRPMAALVLGMPRFKGSSMIVYVFAGAVLINGLSNCICGAWTSFEALLLYVVTFGLSMSVGSSLLYTVPMDMVEMSLFPSALGLLCMLESLSLLIGPPLAGLLVDLTGQYSYVFYACGVCVSSGGFFLMGSFYFLDSKQDKVEEKKKESMKTPSDLYQKPVVVLAPDCQYVASNGRTSENPVYATSV